MRKWGECRSQAQRRQCNAERDGNGAQTPESEMALTVWLSRRRGRFAAGDDDRTEGKVVRSENEGRRSTFDVGRREGRPCRSKWSQFKGEG